MSTFGALLDLLLHLHPIVHFHSSQGQSYKNNSLSTSFEHCFLYICIYMTKLVMVVCTLQEILFVLGRVSNMVFNLTYIYQM